MLQIGAVPIQSNPCINQISQVNSELKSLSPDPSPNFKSNATLSMSIFKYCQNNTTSRINFMPNPVQPNTPPSHHSSTQPMNLSIESNQSRQFQIKSHQIQTHYNPIHQSHQTTQHHTTSHHTTSHHNQPSKQAIKPKNIKPNQRQTKQNTSNLV